MKTLTTKSRRQFPPRSGLTGFTRDDGTWQCTGAQMGRTSTDLDRLIGTVRLRIRRVRLDTGGYDDGGAYWGTPDNLWQVRGTDSNGEIEIFLRGNSKAAVWKQLDREIEHIPAVTSFRIK